MPKRKDNLYETTAVIDGKRYHFYGHTKSEATAKRDRAKELASRCPLAEKKIRLGEWCEAWLESIRNDVAPQTFSSYCYLLRKHIIGMPLAQVLLVNLTPSMFRAQWQQMIDDGFSPRTISYVHTVTSEALKLAVMDGAIMYNPLLNVRRPRQERRQVEALTADQVRELLASIEDPFLLRIIRFALGTGMRRGEILGLAWKDVDFETGRVSVTQSVIRKGGKEVISPALKNASSRRTIPVDHTLLDDLHAQRAYDLALRLKNPDFSNLDLVFCRENGQPLHQNTVTLQAKRLFRALGWENFTFHSLRHTHATLLLRAGIHAKIVQARLGHSTFQQTMDTYSHVTPDMQEGVVEVMEQFAQKSMS